MFFDVLLFSDLGLGIAGVYFILRWDVNVFRELRFQFLVWGGGVIYRGLVYFAKRGQRNFSCQRRDVVSRIVICLGF